MRKGFSIAGSVATHTNIFLKIKTVFLHDAIPEMPMRPAKYFYDKPLPKYLDPKTVLIYLPHPVLHAGRHGPELRIRIQRICN